MKRILIFSLAYYPSFVSGAEAAIKEITDRIAPEDIEFHLITLLFEPKALRKEQIGNTTVYRVGFGGAYLSKILFIPLAALKARSLDAKLHFNALWGMMTYMTMPIVFAKWLGVRAPHILTLQDGDPYEKVFERAYIKPIAFLIDRGIRSAKVIQVISAYLATWPGKRGYKGRIELIHNGANPKDLHDDVNPAEVQKVQEKFGKQPGDIWLVNTARLVYQKGTDDTIRALGELPTHIKFLVVGGGPEEEKLKELTSELGLDERVIFTGPVDRSVVTLYRRASDIFVAPSRSEGLGNAFLSAMASRLPVIATQEGGLAEFIFDKVHNPDKEQTAWIVEKDSSAQIAEAVTYILTHPEEVQKVTARAREMVLQEYDWDMVARQMRERVFNI